MKAFTPHEYQRDIVEWIVQNRRCGVWAGMGVGKSVATLTALEALDAVAPVYPALVLAPLRVANTTWVSEAAKWSHTAHLRVVPISARRNPKTSATAKERLAALNTPADIYTMPYEGLVWLVETLGKDWPFRTVVADELPKLKSFRIRQGGANSGALGKVAHTKVDRFIGLTGTPAANGVKDLWGPTYFIDKGRRLGRTFSAFEQRWFEKGYDGFSLKPMDHAQEEMQELLRDVYLTVEGLPVDKPIVAPQYVDLDPAARKLYTQMENELFAEIEDKGVEAVNAAVLSGKLLQIANGAIYTEDREWSVVHGHKIEALESIVTEASGAPVLVSYNFKHDLERLLKHFPQGRVLDADPRTVERWNSGGIPLLFCHPACLHPLTEVLTETRGWVSLVTVGAHERVFDGVDFVSHKGCVFSGVKSTMEVFGLTMTPNHRLLVGDAWVEARDVRDTGSVKQDALYTYSGTDPRLRALLPVRRDAGNAAAERPAREPRATPVLPALHIGHVSPHDRHPVLADMEGHGRPSHRSERPELQPLRGYWAGLVAGLVAVRELFPRHVSRVPGRPDNRTGGQQSGVQQAELPLGHKHGATVEQGEQPGGALPRARHASGRIVSRSQSEQGGHHTPAEQRHDRRGGSGGLRGVTVQEDAQATPVYDLVDCGPRSRFLVRNAAGEVFVSHNSAGHGLSLQDGGNILARFGFDWNLENYMQILERVGPARQRQSGHNRPVFDYPIIARNTIDEAVFERVHSKRSVQDALLHALKQRRET